VLGRDLRLTVIVGPHVRPSQVGASRSAAALLFLRRMGRGHRDPRRHRQSRLRANEDDDRDLPDVAPAAGVEAFAIQGSFCFRGGAEVQRDDRARSRQRASARS
jgi:hypothetical protein